MGALSTHRMPGWARVALLLAGVLTGGVAQAQTTDKRIPVTGLPYSNGDGMDTHLFRPAIDSKGFFSVNGSDILGANDISFGLVLDYGRNIMRTNDDREDACGTGAPNVPACPNGGTSAARGVDSLAKQSFQGTFGFNYGIANRAVGGLTIPVILMTGDRAEEIGRTNAVYTTTDRLDAQKISTLALHGKYRLLRLEKGIGVAALLQVGVPVAD